MADPPEVAADPTPATTWRVVVLGLMLLLAALVGERHLTRADTEGRMRLMEALVGDQQLTRREMRDWRRATDQTLGLNNAGIQLNAQVAPQQGGFSALVESEVQAHLQRFNLTGQMEAWLQGYDEEVLAQTVSDFDESGKEGGDAQMEPEQDQEPQRGGGDAQNARAASGNCVGGPQMVRAPPALEESCCCCCCCCCC